MKQGEEELLVEWGARAMCALMFLFMALGLCVMCSCSRVVYVPQETIKRDSVYLTSYKRDSIYLRDSVFVRMKSDTLLIEKWRTKYIERSVVDTLYIERTDTLKVPYPVEKQLSKVQQNYISLGKVSAGIWGGMLIALLIYLFVKFRHRLRL